MGLVPLGEVGSLLGAPAPSQAVVPAGQLTLLISDVSRTL